MNIFNKIKPFYFFLSLFIGFFIVYISYPTPEVIIMHPIPGKTDKVIYKDNNNECYKYISKRITCPKNKNIKIIKEDINNKKKNKKEFDILDFIYKN